MSTPQYVATVTLYKERGRDFQFSGDNLRELKRALAAMTRTMQTRHEGKLAVVGIPDSLEGQTVWNRETSEMVAELWIKEWCSVRETYVSIT